MNKFRNIMIDLETFGTGKDAMIVSIGAVAFNPETQEVDEENQFLFNIDLTSSKSPGTMDVNTVLWWMRQSDDARSRLQPQVLGQPLDQALALFDLWARKYSGDCMQLDRELNLWSMPPTFDERILREAYERNGMAWPFHYAVSTCMRTLRKESKRLGIQIQAPETKKHNALDDAKDQAREVGLIYSAIRGLLK